MFTYNDSDINAFIKDCMSKTNMTGLSGRIVLSSDVDPDRVIKLERIQGNEILHLSMLKYFWRFHSYFPYQNYLKQ
jgi:hypothetical protein